MKILLTKSSFIEDKARRSLLSFIQYTKKDYEVNWHHQLIANSIEAWVAGMVPNLIISIPPQHGKSEIVSRRLSPYILGKNPDARIIAASYAAELANDMSRDVQRIMDSDEYKRLFSTRLATRQDTGYVRTANQFEIPGHGGVYRCAGVGGPITGRSGDYLIIDDPFKNHMEAESPTMRDKVYKWYASTFFTRASRNSRKLIIMTRWHKDDLAGRLIKLAAENEHADQWAVINLPAIADDTIMSFDPRHTGDVLWPAFKSLEDLLAIKAVDAILFNALYQGNPRYPEGGFFPRHSIELISDLDLPARFNTRARYWDRAATEGSGDYTQGVKMSEFEKLYFVLSCVGGRLGPDGVMNLIKNTALMDGFNTKIGIEQDPAQAGKFEVNEYIKELVGFPVEAVPVRDNKETRARAFSTQWRAGNVKLLNGPWVEHYLEELEDFPKGKHDDRVDASSGAFMLVAASDLLYRLQQLNNGMYSLLNRGF